MQQPTPETRTRTITWQDPEPSFERARSLSGMEYLQAIMSGEIPAPPIAVTLGMKPVELDHGRAVFAAEPAEYHYNPIGVVHGGLAATLLDSATGCAVQTTLPQGVGYTTLELKTNFVRAITRDTGRVLCEAEVVHRGGTIATAEGRLVAESTGKLLAHGTSTCLIIPSNGARTSGNGNGNGGAA
jgi:uncharacterized protein (TIGR00369 family)